MKANKYLPLLKYLGKVKPAEYKAIIKSAPSGLINAIGECCYNVLRGNVPVTERQKQRLKKYKTLVRAIGDRKLSVKRRRRALLQKGGSFGILSTVLPAAIGLLSNLFN